MTLVDTSVWIDFLGDRDVPHVRRLRRLIEEEENIAICGINLTEILQGIDDELMHRRVERRLSDLILLPLTRRTFVDAAAIYRSLRRVGITLRETNDCVIAASAMEHGCGLLHDDRNFSAIARHLPLAIVS